MQKAGGFIYNVTAEVLSRVYYSVLLVITIKGQKSTWTRT